MNLVGYSDSEASDSEASPAPKPAAKATAKSATKSAPKLVAPGTNKIKVDLSSLTAGADADAEAQRDARPAKRQRTGGGLNINAFLPPPKQPSKPLNNESTYTAKKAVGKGLGKGVNLKTGAEPVFTRSEISSSSLDLDGEPKDIKDVIAELRRNRPQASPAGDAATEANASQTIEKDVKLVGNPMRFKPKSVARGPVRKKAAVQSPATAAPVQRASQAARVNAIEVSSSVSTSKSAPPPKPKVSLFSFGKEPAASVAQPIDGDDDLALADDTEAVEAHDEEFYGHEGTAAVHSYHTAATPSQATGMDGLNLSTAEMRQLFGRKAGKKGALPDLSGVKVVNYNADAQYAENEELRSKGQTVQHNPVRGIAPGKHTLKQLVNAAATQADALEEHFAQGKRNQREAGSRYGW